MMTEGWGGGWDDNGRDPSGQALVSDEAATHLHPSGFDPSRLACFDCGLLYTDPSWVEAVVANHIWNNYLSPTGGEGGILCISCMAKRAVRAGLSDVTVRLTAGPFTTRRVAARWAGYSPTAIATEARRAETLGSVHEGAGPKDIATKGQP